MYFPVINLHRNIYKECRIKLLMSKMRDPFIHLKLGHLLNENPHISVEKIYKVTRKEKIIRSINTLWYTLQYMEDNRIIHNPRCLIKNFKNYTNMHYILKMKDWKEFIDSFAQKYKDLIEMAHCMDAYGESFIYLKTHCELPIPDDITVIEEKEWINFVSILPHSVSTDDLEKALKSEPGTESVLSDFTVDGYLEWGNEIWDAFYWVCVNYRMRNSDLGKLLKKSPQTAYRRRRLIDESILVHYPLFIGGSRSYHPIFLSFKTKYPLFLVDVFSKNTCTSYLIQTKDGGTTCFINTRIPFLVNDAMNRYMETGIIQNLKSIRVNNWWYPFLDDYMKGRIPEENFFMFKSKK